MLCYHFKATKVAVIIHRFQMGVEFLGIFISLSGPTLQMVGEIRGGTRDRSETSVHLLTQLLCIV